MGFEELFQVLSQKNSVLRCNLSSLDTVENLPYIPALCQLPSRVAFHTGSSFFWQQSSSLISPALLSHEAITERYPLCTVNSVSAFKTVGP